MLDSTHVNRLTRYETRADDKEKRKALEKFSVNIFSPEFSSRITNQDDLITKLRIILDAFPYL